MADMYGQFDTDKSLEKDGIWIDYGSFRVLLARAGGANKRYLSYAEAKTKPLRRAMDLGSLSNDRSEAVLHDIFAQTVILNWQYAKTENEDGSVEWADGIPAKDGTTMPVNKENIVATFKNLPNLFFALQADASSAALYRQEDMDDDAKN